MNNYSLGVLSCADGSPRAEQKLRVDGGECLGHEEWLGWRCRSRKAGDTCPAERFRGARAGKRLAAVASLGP